MGIFKNAFSPASSLRDVPPISAEYKKASKKLTFSCKLNKDVLERRVCDIAETSNVPQAYVWEDALIERLLPANEYARKYVVKVLYGRRCRLRDGMWVDYGIRDCLSLIFTDVEESRPLLERAVDSKPLVQFAERLLRRHAAKIDSKYIDPEDPSRDEIRELKFEFEGACAGMDSRAAAGAAKSLAKINLERAEKIIVPQIERGDVPLNEIVYFFIDNWKIVDLPRAYRCMSYMLSLSTAWDDTASDRVEFQGVCETVMSAWSIADDIADERKAAVEAGLKLIKYPISNGDYVLAPISWVELNPLEAPKAKYAGVFVVRYAERYNAPNFLVYMEKPIAEMTDAERNELEVRVEERWPDLAKVHADEVKLEYSTDGGVANAAEVNAAPTTGFFPIYNHGEYPFDGEPPYGAEVFRRNPDAREGGLDSVQ